MKELQKYYVPKDMPAHKHSAMCDRTCYAVYLASEADAAFAALRRQVSELQQCEREIVAEHAEEIERLKAEHEKTLRRQASAALSGMDAAKKISSYQLERAAKLHSESKPEAIDSERRANAILTEENERLRKQAERYEKLRVMTPVQLAFIPTRDIESPEDFDRVVDQLPASGEASAEVQASRTE